MLTQSDLQAIAKIIDEKISPLETKLTKKISAQGKKTDRGFKSVNKKLDVIINYFDNQDIDTRKRLNRIELHLGLIPLNS